MKKWLQEKEIPYDENMLKPQLFSLIKAHKEQHKTYSIDKILSNHNHSVLRLPPYHPDLNPIEMAWAAIKGYVSSKNVNWSTGKVIELVKEKVAVMGAPEWGRICQKIKDIEAEYVKSDHVVDLVTDEFVIFADDDCDTDEESSDDDDGHDYDSEKTITNTSSASADPRPGTSSSFDLMEGISILPLD